MIYHDHFPENNPTGILTSCSGSLLGIEILSPDIFFQ